MHRELPHSSKNESVETTLRIFGNFRQNDWSEWLPLIQYQINSAPSTTTKKAPYELWMGFIPHTYQPERPSLLPEIDKQKEDLLCARFQAQKAMRRAGELRSKQTKWTPYIKGQKVWSEGTHLSTSHPFVELHPKQFGPIQITGMLDSVMYRLNLLEKWKIHNTFHATLLSPYVETEKYGVNFTEPPPDPIRNKPKKECGGISLWQQCYNELQEKERQLKTSVLKAIKQNHETQKELGSKKCIKASRQSKRMTNSLHHYMNGLLSTHRQQCPMGRHLMCPTGSLTDIPRMEPVGATCLPRQPRSRATVAIAPLRGENLWPAPTAAVPSSGGSTRGAGPSLEPNQPPPDTWEEEADASGTPPPNPEASQHQPAVFEACTKNPLTDEETHLVIVHLPRPSPTSHECCATHLPHLKYPLICVCPSTPRPHNVILQALCDLSIPWATELRIYNQDTGRGPSEYQP